MIALSTWRSGNGHWALWRHRKVIATISRLSDTAYRWTVDQQEGIVRSKRAAQSAIGRCLRRLAARQARQWQCARCRRQPPVVKVPTRNGLCCVVCAAQLRSQGSRWCRGCQVAHPADQFRPTATRCRVVERAARRAIRGEALERRRAQNRAYRNAVRKADPAAEQARQRAHRERKKLRIWGLVRRSQQPPAA